MGRALLVINSEADRRKAALWANKAPWGTRIEFKASKRTPPQNDRMWAMLTEVADQLTYHGVKMPTDDWKLVFLDALKREIRMVPNLDGTGFVNLGRSSSDLTKEEMTALIEIIFAYGAQHGVVFKEPANQNGAAA
ncbi:NinB family protein [Sinorhizobium fredii]|uniref:NinB family protein n=1 Tax=Rhizobium fredii TaxID=380 RepID=A0A2A6LXM2_RHIFR|nr:recombination protein NinB [Sinorhizobium fredii]PDT47291.1 NinB family protein [Sinorhizobium fredii]